MQLNWKRNSTFVIGLCVALFVAVIIIAFLLWPKSEDERGSLIPDPSRNPSPQPIQNPPPRELPRGVPPSPDTPVGTNKPALVLFYMEQCIHSRNMMPSWQQMKQTLDQTGHFDIISLEASDYPQEMQQHKVSGFPMVRFYPQGFPGPNPIDYRGNRTAESLIKFVRSGGKET